MDQAERRIRKLKMRSTDDSLLLQARYRLEEAFRTATLPGLPPNAQVLIRRIDLGPIRADLSPSLLAEKISDLVQDMATSAVCVDQLSHPAADVVWFSDPLQPYVSLLTRLLDAKPANEWYWDCLFPAQSLQLNGATIDRLLSAAATTPLKGLATAHLLQQVIAPQRLARLVPWITPALASRLLQQQGLSPVVITATRPVDERRQHHPLAVHAPPIAAPAAMSADWQAAVQYAAAVWGVNDVRTLWLAWHALLWHQPGYLDSKQALQRIAVKSWLDAWSLRVRNASPPARRTGAEQQATTDDALRRERRRDDGAKPAQDAYPFSPLADHSPFSAFRPGKARGPRRLPPGHDQAAGQAGVPGEVAQTPGREHPAPHSRHAGFIFSIPLLQRIGMADLLQHNEALLACDFPRRLLWAIAQRFALADDDPAQQLFDGLAAEPDVMLERLRLPPLWPQLTTPSGRPLRHSSTISLHALLNTTQLIAGVYLRRFCAISLRTLLQREGRVLLTPTHWDAIFDINQTDLRLRRVALDSNPGWVTWLGKVVQFHYDSEGQRYV